ncbi:MAG: dethiobiotin synthase [Simkaniaceae bacterium]|nr:dethiobiotin synthase [Simkaniaceae bacterium]
MDRIIVAGIGTDVGKTVFSAILTEALEGEYWKPVQTGAGAFDTDTVSLLLSPERTIHPPAYSLKEPASPHSAAESEGILIDPDRIIPPASDRPLIIESAGGVCVPLRSDLLTIDLFKKWEARWIVVSKQYLGSINHTLLTVHALKAAGIDLAGIIFNGEANSCSEEAILAVSQVPCLGHVAHEQRIDASTIRRYAKQWTHFGTLLHKCKRHLPPFTSSGGKGSI